MPSRASYLLRISGRLRADGLDPKEVERNVRGLVGNKPGNGLGELGPGDLNEHSNAGEDWPVGFVLKGYDVCEWDARAEAYGYGEILVNFRAEIHRVTDGTLYQNHPHMLEEVRWFYTYRNYKWHASLKNILAELNKKYSWVEPIWFREYQWYCGNGGP